MEKFHLILRLTTSFFVFVPCLAHSEKAVANIHVPNFEKEDTSSKLKILKVKRRETDYCERVIQNYGTNTRSICSRPSDASSVCTSPLCKTKPSPPEKLDYAIHLNKTTKKVDLHITWKRPETGLSSLCGFQIHLTSLKSPYQTICIQLNSKSLFSYSISGFSFNARYNITVLSLPSYEDIDRSSSFIEVISPDKCTVLKQLNESLPWKCEIKQNFTISCENGSFNITLEKLHKVDVDGYFCTLMRREPLALPGRETMHTKDHPFAAYSNLTLNVKYVLSVTVVKEGEAYTVQSQPFTCKDYPDITKGKEIDLLWKILPPAIFCILLALLLFICIKYKVISKLRECFRSRYRGVPPDKAEGVHLREHEQVNL